MRELVREFIREQDLLSEDRLEEVFRLEEETGQSFERIILHKGYMSENDILRTMAHALVLDYVPVLRECEVPEEFLANVPVNFARNYSLVGVGQENGAVRVATAFPLDTHPMDDLAHMLQTEIEPVLAPRAEDSIAARSPAPPAPTTITSCSCVSYLLIHQPKNVHSMSFSRTLWRSRPRKTKKCGYP